MPNQQDAHIGMPRPAPGAKWRRWTRDEPPRLDHGPSRITSPQRDQGNVIVMAPARLPLTDTQPHLAPDPTRHPPEHIAPPRRPAPTPYASLTDWLAPPADLRVSRDGEVPPEIPQAFPHGDDPNKYRNEKP